ncbi:MAG: class I SAM-dependent methyltransferase [Candidatus Aenigmarchaeota archaeon]|nr:class I SAM-dependent methyltransferase [Candidatus Aenigmarchaeota archaeon]
MNQNKIAEKLYQNSVNVRQDNLERLLVAYKGDYYFNLVDRLAGNKDAVIVDGMGGTGFFTVLLAKRGYKNLLVFDLSENNIKAARALFKRHKIKARALVSDIEKIRLKDNFTDLVVVMTSLHHLPSRTKALRECKRILKPGGYLLAIEPNKLNPLALWRHWRSKPSVNEKLFSSGEIRSEIAPIFPEYRVFTHKFGYKIIIIGRKPVRRKIR